MGLSLVPSERTSEELEELFRTIVDDNDFLHLCEEEINKTHFPPQRDQHGKVVHEINMSVFYNVEVDRNNADLTFVQRSINVIPKEKTTAATTRRRATICSLVNEEKHDFDPASLERIVEQQLEAARRAGSLKNFQPIDNNAARTQTISRTKFVAPPVLEPKIPPRPRVEPSVPEVQLRRAKPSPAEEKLKLTTPLKSIRRQMHHRNSTAGLNRKVSEGRREEQHDKHHYYHYCCCSI
jgi:hypothetical protein